MGFLVSEDGMDVDQDPGLRSLLDLARENLALKQQLKSANHELSRLQDAVQKHQSERHLRKQKQLEQESQSRYWTGEEHLKFLEAIESFGPKDVKAIATFVGSRSATQVRTHAQKYFMKLAREKSSGNDAECGGHSSSEATEGGGSRSSSMPSRNTHAPNGRSKGDSGGQSESRSRSPMSSGDASSRSPPSRGSSCGPDRKPPSDTSGSDGFDASGSGGTDYGGRSDADK